MTGEPARLKPWPRCGTCGGLIQVATGRCVQCDFPQGECAHCHQEGSLGDDGLCGICSMAMRGSSGG